jgi:NitT/TauT family transport system permease protein
VTIAPPLLLIILIVIIWQVLIGVLAVPEYLVPTPLRIAGNFFDNMPRILYNTWITYYETLIGYVLAIAFGLLSALLLVYSDFFRRCFYPLALGFQALPKTALAPLFIVWFGVGILPKVVIALIIAYFPIMVTMTVGFGDVSADMLELARSMRATKRQVFTKIRLPHSLPYFFSSLKVALPMAIVGAIVGEFIASMEGLGNLLLVSTAFSDTPMLFSCLIMLMAASAIILAIISIIESLTLKWQPEK